METCYLSRDPAKKKYRTLSEASMHEKGSGGEIIEEEREDHLFYFSIFRPTL